MKAYHVAQGHVIEYKVGVFNESNEAMETEKFEDSEEFLQMLLGLDARLGLHPGTADLGSKLNSILFRLADHGTSSKVTSRPSVWLFITS